MISACLLARRAMRRVVSAASPALLAKESQSTGSHEDMSRQSGAGRVMD